MSRADYDTEARELTDWLFAQADVYRKYAPGLTDDIRRFEDAAALIDSYRAGLTLVDPHPLMQMELVRWVHSGVRMPAAGETVLLFFPGNEIPSIGYHDGEIWRSAEDIPFGCLNAAIYWAEMPAGPQITDMSARFIPEAAA